MTPSHNPVLSLDPFASRSADCIHHLFAQQAALTPDRIAVECAGRQLTYRQLDERANRWAHRLRSMGVGPETNVGLCLERSPELVVAIYAILKAGGAYVPLDPYSPVNRLAMIIEDAAPVVLLTQRSLASRCDTFAGPRLWVDDEPADEPSSPPVTAVHPENAAYVIFTSGSTGRPKGVVVEHRSLVHFVRAASERPGVTENDVVLSVIDVAFDMSVFDWFVPLALGARLVVGPGYLRTDGAGLMTLLRDRGATLLRATPATFKALLHAGWNGLPGLKMLSGGEALPPDLARELLPRCGQLWNCYGPTETTAFTTAGLIEEPDDITIGAPIGQARLYVVDEQLRIVPAGTEGELLLGGPGLARGYLNQPALTADRFIPDHLSEIPSARLYRTGDLGRLRADGRVEFLGRIDTQVKLHGFRIELGEIETALRAIAGVQDAAVVLHTPASGEKQLVAFIVPQSPDSAPSDSRLQSALTHNLPGYMIPSRYQRIAALPLSPTGKIDRKALGSIMANPSPPDQPAGECIHHLFEQQAARTPDRIAVEFTDQHLTYRQLDERANRWAWRLRDMGVGPGTRVGLCVERSLELVVALYAVLKAGGAYVPLDPHFPANRLTLILEDAAPLALITQRSLSGRCALFNGPRLWVDEEPADGSASPPGVPLTDNDAAYVIYTSGSTGRPKGVVLEHRSVVNLMHSVRERPGLTERDVVLGVITVSFDMSVFDWFPPLAVGARLVVAPGHLRSDGAGLMALIEKSGATMTHATPSVWKALLQAGWSGQPGYKPLLGGEACPPDLARELLSRCDEVWNLYGPTETTVFSAAARIETADDIHIGTPIARTTLHVMDESLRPVPAGVEGELLIGGRGLARGYLNQPELTAERFIPDPFSTEPGARLYRTGDLVRLRADGNIDCLGRIDTQVKLHGFRIELGEIETALRAITGVQDAVVALSADASGEKHLVAFIVPSPACEEPSDRQLQTRLGQNLPGYMIPVRFTRIAALPLTPGGKVDRRALAVPVGAEPAADRDQERPHEDIGQQAVAVWREVLRREHIDVHDNFFDLGGHSLLAVIICSKLSRLLGRSIPLRWIFEYPTLDKLLGQMKSGEALRKMAKGSEPITRRPSGPSSPVSFTQQGMVLLHQLLPEPAAYNVAVVWRIVGRLDRPRLLRSLQAMLARHEILRTSLDSLDDTPSQQIAGIGEISVPWRELNATVPPSHDPSARAREILGGEIRRGFDLGKPPLWRVVCVSLGTNEQVLAFVFHHSIIDEWSLGLFATECSALYSADGRPEFATLPALPIHYADYAAWQRRQLTGETLIHLESYWRTQLADLPPALELPCARHRSATASGNGAEHRFQLKGEIVTRLRKLARTEETSLFTVMLTAFQVWLYRVTGQDDVIVSTPTTRRNQPELMTLVGCFLNTLPVRARLKGGDDFRDTLRQVRNTLTEAIHHADLPFEQMVSLALRDRSSSHAPLHQIMFALTEEPRSSLKLDDTTATPFELPTTTSKNDLSLFIDAQADTWNLRVEYATDLLDAEAVGRMAGQFNLLLESLVATPSLPINRLPLLPEAEYRQVVETWNRTDAPYDRDRCIHTLFEEQAALTPGAPAVACDETVITYRELNDTADRIADRLRMLGVTPGSLVALRPERSPDHVAALLGILKAGGAYWALEDKIPEQRLRLMLADARPAVLVARAQSLSDQPADLVPVVALEVLLASPATHPAVPPASAPRPEDPAYVNYTSGSTGHPKGVLVPHRGVVRLVRGNNYVSLTPRETLLHHSPLSFDASTFELWGALLNGGCVALPPPGLLSLADIGEAIRRHRVTTMFITTGLFHLMVDEHLDALKPLRQLLAGGDVLSPAHVRKCRQAFPHLHFVAAYGPTENTTFTSCHTVTDATLSDATVSIGRPIANTSVYVLDPLLQPVPVGVAGELYTSGDGLALGYLNQPQLTAERFIHAPFRPGSLLYRTGDGARWRADGELEFLGRLDSQVKIRGFRVELGEIEAVLREIKGVRAATVLCRPSPDGGKWIVAYVVADPTAHADTRKLKSVIREKLPEYMMPAVIDFLPALPLNRNGKIDRHALPEPAVAPATDQPFSAPETGLETKLAGLWRHLFQRETIGRHENFFDLGGHSLLAARLAVGIEKLTGRRLPIAALFQAPTIARLARMLQEEDTGSRFSSLVTLQPRGTLPALFCIHGWAGEVYVFLDLAKQLGPERPVYGLQAVGLDERQPRHTSVEEMAAHYAREIRLRQPAGPYHLVGYSLGGWIAYAVAQELTRQGCKVALLGLLETSATARLPTLLYARLQIPRLPGIAWYYLNHWKIYWRRFRAGPGTVQLRYWLKRLRHQWGHYTVPHLQAPETTVNPDIVQNFLGERSGDYSHGLVSDYRPQKYPGDLVLFAGDDFTPELWVFWKYLIKGRLTFRRIAGDHHSLLSHENSPSFAKSLSEALRQAETVSNA